MRRPIVGSLWLLHTSFMRKKIGIKLMAERPAPKIMSFDKKRLNAVNMIMSFVKMAILVPTGQWYAPSAVMNDAWYCMV